MDVVRTLPLPDRIKIGEVGSTEVPPPAISPNTLNLGTYVVKSRALAALNRELVVKTGNLIVPPSLFFEKFLNGLARVV